MKHTDHIEERTLAAPGDRIKLVTEDALNTLYDRDNPDSLINRLPVRLVPIFERVKRKLPKMLLNEERELRKYCSPDTRDERVRLSFWDEYNASTSVGKRMSLQSIISGGTSWEVWATAYEPNDRKMLWIFCPPVSYVNAMRHILHRGTERMLEIMNFPMITKDGKVDTKVANLVLRAWQLADMRMKGGIMQKVQIEQKSLNLNLNAEQSVEQARDSLRNYELEDLEALERRIEKAKREQSKYLKGATPENREMIIDAMTKGDMQMLEDTENISTYKMRDDDIMPRLPKELDYNFRLSYDADFVEGGVDGNEESGWKSDESGEDRVIHSETEEGFSE